jgi:non-homologous end joining protein Ku
MTESPDWKDRIDPLSKHIDPQKVDARVNARRNASPTNPSSGTVRRRAKTPRPIAAPPKVINLMEALKRSLMEKGQHRRRRSALRRPTVASRNC